MAGTRHLSFCLIGADCDVASPYTVPTVRVRSAGGRAGADRLGPAAAGRLLPGEAAAPGHAGLAGAAESGAGGTC